MPIRRAGAHCRRLLESGRLTLIDHWDYSKYEFALETAPQSGERCVADAYFEARQLPFIFQLYPGGGFLIDQPESDAKLRRVVLSDYCRKVIVTQRLSHESIVDRSGCDLARSRADFWRRVQVAC